MTKHVGSGLFTSGSPQAALTAPAPTTWPGPLLGGTCVFPEVESEGGWSGDRAGLATDFMS